MYDFVFLCVQCSKFWCRNRPGDEMKDKYNNSFISAMTMSEEMPEGSKSSSPFCHPKFTTSTFFLTVGVYTCIIYTIVHMYNYYVNTYMYNNYYKCAVKYIYLNIY